MKWTSLNMHSIYWEKKKGYVLVHAEKTYVSMEEHKTLRNDFHETLCIFTLKLCCPKGNSSASRNLKTVNWSVANLLPAVLE